MSWYSIVRRGGTSSLQWDPASLSSLASWWDADAVTGIASGGTLATWPDSHGSLDGTGGSATWQANVLNAKSVVRYSGTQGHLIGSNTVLDGVPGALVVMVAKTVVTTLQYGFAWRGPDTYDRINLGRLDLDQALLDFEVPTFHRSRPVVSGLDEWAIYMTFRDGASAYSRFNGVTTGSSSYNGDPLPTGSSLGIGIGYSSRRGANIEVWNGDIAEVQLHNDAVSFSDAEKIEGYLAHKWGLTANLPVAHPFKTVAPTA